MRNLRIPAAEAAKLLALGLGSAAGSRSRRCTHRAAAEVCASGRTPVSPLATVFLSCGASVGPVALFFSSLNSARPSLERELCYYLRKSGSGLAVWFEGKISCIFFYWSFSEITSIC